MDIDTGKLNAKKRKVFKDSKDRTYVKQGDKKVYVKKLFTPKRNASPAMPIVVNRGPGLSPMINIKKVDAKKRKVFQDSKGRTYVKPGDKKIYVKKVFTPSRETPTPIQNLARSPVINTEKVNAKGRKVFKDSKGRTHVKQDGKKVYVKKLFTPARPTAPVVPAVNPREKPRKAPPRKLLQPSIAPRVSADCGTTAGLRQVSSTCWFNASLNGFVLAEATAKMLFDKIKLLSSSEIVALAKDFPTDSCPIRLSRKYVFHYFMKIHSDNPIIWQKKNSTVGLMNKIFTPKALSTPVAKGKEGGHPFHAARQILGKVFNIGETGTLRDWETICPPYYRHYTMVYRDGPLAAPLITPDSHPLVIKTENGKTKFNLSHLVYVMKRKQGNHAVVGYVCGGKKYLYDSNKLERLELDWSDPENREEILEYSNAITFEYVAYCLYVRE